MKRGVSYNVYRRRFLLATTTTAFSGDLSSRFGDSDPQWQCFDGPAEMMGFSNKTELGFALRYHLFLEHFFSRPPQCLLDP